MKILSGFYNTNEFLDFWTFMEIPLTSTLLNFCFTLVFMRRCVLFVFVPLSACASLRVEVALSVCGGQRTALNLSPHLYLVWDHVLCCLQFPVARSSGLTAHLGRCPCLHSRLSSTAQWLQMCTWLLCGFWGYKSRSSCYWPALAPLYNWTSGSYSKEASDDTAACLATGFLLSPALQEARSFSASVN